RRHTRFSRDWSSDVCSSDLLHSGETALAGASRYGGTVPRLLFGQGHSPDLRRGRCCPLAEGDGPVSYRHSPPDARRRSVATVTRSEERRVGKEGGPTGATDG